MAAMNHPQLTPRAILLGIILSMLLAAANAYLGLYAGLTVSASIPAAVVSMAILRALRNSNVLENNIVQTAASAGESIAAGAIFTLPALILLEYWTDFDYWWVVFICGVGGLLGVLCTVPLRHAFITDDQLSFPEGRATAVVLEAGHGEAGGAVSIMLSAALIAAVAKLAVGGLKLWTGITQGAAWAGQWVMYFGANLSPALLGVGYIVGLNVALLVFAGGVITWCIAVPLYALMIQTDTSLPALEVATQLWASQLRYMGVGAMLVGGLWALWDMRGALLAGVSKVIRNAGSDTDSDTQRDLPTPFLIGLLIMLAVPMGLFYQSLINDWVVALPLTLIMLIAAFLFSAVAAYMAGLVGSSNNPVSGVTIATILLTSLGLVLMLGNEIIGPVAAILVGAVVCCGAAIAGDNMQDLKAGAILGATPWKQQLAQMIGVISAVMVLAPVMSLLLKAYGFGVPTDEHPEPLAAPQATLMAAVARGVFGGDLPWTMVAIGAAIAVAVILFDLWLRARGSRFRAPVLAVAVGLYLPMKYTIPIALGGVVAWMAGQARGGQGKAMLCAAGLITGEALMGIALAIPIVISGRSDALALLDQPLGAWPAVVVIVGLAAWLYRCGKNDGLA